jgi:hypothetical protein
MMEMVDALLEEAVDNKWDEAQTLVELWFIRAAEDLMITM